MAEKANGFDFASIDGHLDEQENGREVAINLPTPNGPKPTGLKITVAGPDSEVVRRALRWNRDALSETDLTDEKKVEIEIETSVRCATGWSGATYQGNDVPWSRDEAKKWFARWPFITSQVAYAAADRSRFFKA